MWTELRRLFFRMTAPGSATVCGNGRKVVLPGWIRKKNFLLKTLSFELLNDLAISNDCQKSEKNGSFFNKKEAISTSALKKLEKNFLCETPYI